MVKHRLYLRMPAKALLHKDAELDVYSNDRRLGTLKMSKGSIEWLPANHHSGYHLTWEAFGALMEENGRRRNKPA